MYRTLLPSPDAGGFAPRPYAARPCAGAARAMPDTPNAGAGPASQYDLNDGFLAPGADFGVKPFNDLNPTARMMPDILDAGATPPASTT